MIVDTDTIIGVKLLHAKLQQQQAKAKVESMCSYPVLPMLESVANQLQPYVPRKGLRSCWHQAYDH